MRSPRSAVVVLALLASACTSVGNQLEGLQTRAVDTADRVQFCLAVTRALTSVDGGTAPSEAQAAAEEVLAQVPDELRADAELVADRLRETADTGDRSALDEEFRTAAASLRAGTQELCDPRR
ncbi:MAG: hypothetical protein WEB03_01060 [Nitriliruptor sp.]|uniref:hypothetical protein n=1 Tax=Nitriliruptor sp. TaxID=2448056 RepID=UPI0034A06C9F